MTAKIKIPSCNAVKLGKHAGCAHLAAYALRLFCGCKLAFVAEHINSRQAESAILAHTVTYCTRLRTQKPFVHHMTRHKDIVFTAPFTDVIRISGSEALRNVIEEKVSYF